VLSISSLAISLPSTISRISCSLRLTRDLFVLEPLPGSVGDAGRFNLEFRPFAASKMA
jgi:hypothetical protein